MKSKVRYPTCLAHMELSQAALLSVLERETMGIALNVQ